MSEHELSVVITSRNDDFGGDMLRRIQLFSDNLLTLGDRFGLDAEIVIVEWNPPPGPRLHEALKPSVSSSRIPIRFIEVPGEVHAQLRNSDVIPLYQMIAKNVGIRRARGRFVLCTNQDLLFSNELVEFLASGELDADVMYRIDRTDVEAEVPSEASVDAQLDWCADHAIRTHKARGTVPTLRKALRDPSIRRGFLRANPPRRLIRAALLLLQRKPAHTNACGDFTLCARQRWNELRGYAEIPIYSLHIDSLFCYAAVAAGLRQVVLRPPLRCYHLEHESSWAVMSPGEKLDWFRERPWLDIEVVNEVWAEMRASGRPIITNGPDWGLDGLDAREVQLLNGELNRNGG